MVQMCPDRQILSVYFDRELPSPWKDQLEAHLEKCPACRDRLDRLGALSRRIGGKVTARSGEADPEFSAAAAEREAVMRAEELAERTARERVWQNIAAGTAGAFAGKVPGTAGQPGGRRQLWNRSISVPVPALAAAAALLVFAVTAVLIFNPRGGADGQELAEAVIAAELSPDMPAIIPVSDMNSLLRYLGEDTGDIVIIRLPESKNFMSEGKPTIIKAADYSRRSTSP
jgi:anti-sigma factor RsiW